jgi:cellulose synthase (UDP-forming)
MMTEHKVRLFLDEGESLKAGIPVTVVIDSGEYRAELSGAVTDVHLSASGGSRKHTVEILDFNGTEYEYRCLLYHRIPTLPQSLQKDFGIFRHLWQNIAHRVARTRL